MTKDELRKARSEIGVSQNRLGEMLGITGDHVQKMEAGTYKITRQTELAIEFLKINKSVLDLSI